MPIEKRSSSAVAIRRRGARVILMGILKTASLTAPDEIALKDSVDEAKAAYKAIRSGDRSAAGSMFSVPDHELGGTSHRIEYLVHRGAETLLYYHSGTAVSDKPLVSTAKMIEYNIKLRLKRRSEKKAKRKL